MEPIQKTLEEKLEELRRNHPKTSRPIPPQPSNDLGNPNCPECHGIGYWRYDVPRGHPEFAKLHVCKCRDKEVKSYKQSASGLIGSELELAWKDVKLIDNAEEAIATIKAVLIRGFGWVYLWGGPGNAKTMLLQIAVAECLRNNQDATYTKLSKIMDNMREAYDKEYPNTEAINRMNRWTNIPILAIDELDKIRGTEYEKTQRLELFDDRYTTALRMENITLTAANVPPEDLGNEYLASRARDHRFKVINMQSPDMRPAMSWPFDA